MLSNNKVLLFLPQRRPSPTPARPRPIHSPLYSRGDNTVPLSLTQRRHSLIFASSGTAHFHLCSLGDDAISLLLAQRRHSPTFTHSETTQSHICLLKDQITEIFPRGRPASVYDTFTQQLSWFWIQRQMTPNSKHHCPAVISIWLSEADQSQPKTFTFPDANFRPKILSFSLSVRPLRCHLFICFTRSTPEVHPSC